MFDVALVLEVAAEDGTLAKFSTAASLPGPPVPGLGVQFGERVVWMKAVVFDTGSEVYKVVADVSRPERFRDAAAIDALAKTLGPTWDRSPTGFPELRIVPPPDPER